MKRCSTYYLYRKTTEPDSPREDLILLAELQGTPEDAETLLNTLKRMNQSEFYTFELDKE